MEIWKDIAGWEGLYQVSDHGRVKALPRSFVTKNRWGEMVKHLPERVSRLNLTKGNHYLAVTLTRKGRVERRLVHRAVCEAFHGPCPSQYHHCAHGDGDPTNNNASNLRWATVKENVADTRKHGNMRLGEKCNWSKLNAEQVLEIRRRAAGGEAFTALGREFGMTSVGISKIVNRENWRHI
jgi:hypothetical protein